MEILEKLEFLTDQNVIDLANINNEKREEILKLDLSILTIFQLTVLSTAISLSCTYGKQVPKKIILDHRDILSEVKDKKDRGDASINDQLFIEMKGSFSKLSSNNYSVKNIRTYQNLDYYVIWLLNHRDVNDYNLQFFAFDPKFFNQLTLSFQNGTAKRNKHNKWEWKSKDTDGNIIDYLVDPELTHYSANLYDYEAYK